MGQLGVLGSFSLFSTFNFSKFIPIFFRKENVEKCHVFKMLGSYSLLKNRVLLMTHPCVTIHKQFSMSISMTIFGILLYNENLKCDKRLILCFNSVGFNRYLLKYMHIKCHQNMFIIWQRAYIWLPAPLTWSVLSGMYSRSMRVISSHSCRFFRWMGPRGLTVRELTLLAKDCPTLDVAVSAVWNRIPI